MSPLCRRIDWSIGLHGMSWTEYEAGISYALTPESSPERVCGKDVAVTHADLVPCQQAGASPARPVSGLSSVCSETCLSKVMQGTSYSAMKMCKKLFVRD